MKKTLLITSLIIICAGVGLHIFDLTEKLNDGVNTETENQVSSYPATISYTVLDNPEEKVEIDPEIKLVMFGDSMVGDPLTDMVIEGHNPYAFMIDEFNKYDLVIGNLETTIDGVSHGTPQNKNFTFSAPERFADLIKEAGVDVLNMANNHSMDYGGNALLWGIQKLHNIGIATFGAGENLNEAFKPYIVDVKGTKIAFIGINSAEYSITMATENSPGSGYFQESLVSNSIQAARNEGAQVVIVWCHWGDEHSLDVNDWQRDWARKIINAGADLIVGMHPHVREEYSQYNGKWVFYSLGNFVFTGMGWDPEAVKGYLLDVRINKGVITAASVKTVEINYQGFPHFPE